ncbi:MAG: hypothetical protein ACM3ZB_15990 [bacterium]
MRRFVLLLLTASLAAAQDPAATTGSGGQAPKEIDDALRARVTQFYQAHVDRKWRLALDAVAEDSQDYFLERQKPEYYGFSISSIAYSDGFTRAIVSVICDTEVFLMGRGRSRLKVPLSSQWKLENGQWYWFASRPTERETPFGTMKLNSGPAPEAAAGTSGGAAGLPAGIEEAMAKGAAGVGAVANRRAVTADKTTIVLDAGKPSSDVITLSNSLNGAMGLEVFVVETPGLTARAEQKFIPAGGSTRVVFDYNPSGPPSVGKVYIRVLPIGPVIPVKVTFNPPQQEPENGKAAPAAPAVKPGAKSN